jgi:hypothetical protein
VAAVLETAWAELLALFHGERFSWEQTLVQWSRGGAKLTAPALISCPTAQMALHVLRAKLDHLNHAGITLCGFNQRGLLT